MLDKLFGAVVRTTVNVALLPVAVAKDAITLGGTTTDRRRSYTAAHLDKIKDEASE